MTSLIIGPIYLTYEKIKEHREGKKRIRNSARYEDLRREHDGNLDLQEEERMRLDQQRLQTGFSIPEPTADGQVRLGHDWEAQREAQWSQPRQQRSRATSLRVDHTGHYASNTLDADYHNRGSFHSERRTGGGSGHEWDRDRHSPVPRRSLQANPSGLGHEFGSNDSLSDRSSPRQHTSQRSAEASRSREYIEPYVTEAPKPREEEPKDMSALFVDDLLRERGLAR